MRVQEELEGIGATRDADGVRDGAELGELLLEGVTVGPERQVHRRKGLLECAHYLVFEILVLQLQVNKGNSHWRNTSYSERTCAQGCGCCRHGRGSTSHN